MDDTPHHLSHDTSATPPPLSRMADLNTSHYYVVQTSEYDAMKTKIERLRAAGDALHAWITINATSAQQESHDYNQVLDAWEEARRG